MNSTYRGVNKKSHAGKGEEEREGERKNRKIRNILPGSVPLVRSISDDILTTLRLRSGVVHLHLDWPCD
jgi:hypothetical protein